MNSNPLVSVLMTAYNRERYIASAIESVLASSYVNFELIVVDDCSTDRTVEVVKSFTDRDQRIKIYVNDSNLGQFENRNLAARYANGTYLKYLDSDDLIYPTGLEVLINMMEKFPDAGYGLCSLEQDDIRVFPFMLSPKEAYERHFLQGLPLFHKAPLSAIIKRDIFHQVGGFNNSSGEGDYEMWLFLSTKNNVVLMPDGVTWYRVHDEQIDFQRRNDPFIRFRYFLVTLKYMGQNCPLFPEQARKITRETHNNITKYIIMTFFKYSPGKAIKMYRSANYSFAGFLGCCFYAALQKLRK